MSTLVVLGLVLLVAGLGFSAWNAEAAGAFIKGVQFAGFAIMLLMLWRHWTGRPGMWRS